MGSLRDDTYHMSTNVGAESKVFYFNKFQEDANRGKPNWEHLADDLHVLLTVEDTENRAKIKLARAVDEVKRLLVPVSITNYNFTWSSKYN